jgi:hypothetical protein
MGKRIEDFQNNNMGIEKKPGEKIGFLVMFQIST